MNMRDIDDDDFIVTKDSSGLSDRRQKIQGETLDFTTMSNLEKTDSTKLTKGIRETWWKWLALFFG